MKRRDHVLSTFITVIFYLGLLWLSNRYYHRSDVTSQRLFSLSSESLHVINQLNKKVTLRILFHPDHELAKKLDYLLEAYRATSQHLSVVNIKGPLNPWIL